MVEVTNALCTGVDVTKGQKRLFIPQITSTLRREFVFWENREEWKKEDFESKKSFQ